MKSIEQQYQDEIDELKRERELLLRAAYINGAEWASLYHGEVAPKLPVIEEAYTHWRTKEPI